MRKLSSARPQLGRAEPSFSTTDQHFCQVEMLHKFSVLFSQIFVQIAQIKNCTNFLLLFCANCTTADDSRCAAFQHKVPLSLYHALENLSILFLKKILKKMHKKCEIRGPLIVQNDEKKLRQNAQKPFPLLCILLLDQYSSKCTEQRGLLCAKLPKNNLKLADCTKKAISI